MAGTLVEFFLLHVRGVKFRRGRIPFVRATITKVSCFIRILLPNSSFPCVWMEVSPSSVGFRPISLLLPQGSLCKGQGQVGVKAQTTVSTSWRKRERWVRECLRPRPLLYSLLLITTCDVVKVQGFPGNLFSFSSLAVFLCITILQQSTSIDNRTSLVEYRTMRWPVHVNAIL